MPIRAPRLRHRVGSALLMLLAGCLQGDQTLPFDLGADGSAQVDIGDNGGIVSLLPSIAIHFPAGSFAGVVTVRPLDGPFPDEAGVPVLGTAFDVEPAGTTLAGPARVELNVPIGGLQPGDEVRLAVGVARSDGSVVAFQGTYDITNGILTAEVDELGPIAAIVFADAIPVALGPVPTLDGGVFTPPPSAPSPGAALTSHGGIEFAADCAPDARLCFSAGVVELWADDVVQERLGDTMFLVGADVRATLDFFDFVGSVPRSVVGEISIEGELRARVASTVTSDDLVSSQSTGPGTVVAQTTVTLVDNEMVFGETSGGIDSVFEYDLTGGPPNESLTVRVEGEMVFDNDDGSSEVGRVVAHVRLQS